MENKAVVSENILIQNKIYTIRNTQVMLDRDLADFYEIKATRLREQVNRNIDKFPNDFMFELTENEIDFMVSQNAIPSRQHLGGSKPMVFTEQVVSMIPSVLKSEKATNISIEIIRTFVNMRKFIYQNNYLFQRMDLIEEKQKNTDQKVDEILNAIESKNTTIKQGVFYDGQFFDAYIFISDILKQAQKSITKEVKLDIEKYNKQNNNLNVIKYEKSHDRFLILDNKIIYHLGASLKDLGNKWFAFSKFENDNLELLIKVNDVLEGKQ